MPATDVATGERPAVALLEFAGSPALAELERLLSDSRTERCRALERFAADDRLPELERLMAEARARPPEIDFLDLLGVYWQESVHSKFLGWLLDPAQTHGVGDCFLKNFLLEAVNQAQMHGTAPANADDIAAADWSESGVTLEWYSGGGYLDILVVNSKERILCGIENKIFSPEGGRQLTHYRRELETNYPDFVRHYVFLSPSAMPSQWEEDRQYWTPVSYTAVLQVIERMLEDASVAITTEVRVLLSQYATTLRRKIVPDNSDSEINRLARKIYLEQKEVIDLIYRHRPDYTAEAKQIFKEAVSQQEDWSLDREDTAFVRFRSDAWSKFQVTQTGTGWLPQSSALLLFEVCFRDGKPYLQLALSPGIDDEATVRVREKLFEAARQNPKLFQPTSRTFHQGFMLLLQEADCILDDSDYGSKWDDGCSVRAKIMAWVDDFAANRFPAMNEVIVNCLRDYEAEQGGQPEPGQ